VLQPEGARRTGQAGCPELDTNATLSNGQWMACAELCGPGTRNLRLVGHWDSQGARLVPGLAMCSFHRNWRPCSPKHIMEKITLAVTASRG